MAYMTEWYRLHYKTALDLILIISRSNAVIKLTAGKMIQLSLATFGDVSLSDVPQTLTTSRLHNKISRRIHILS